MLVAVSTDFINNEMFNHMSKLGLTPILITCSTVIPLNYTAAAVSNNATPELQLQDRTAYIGSTVEFIVSPTDTDGVVPGVYLKSGPSDSDLVDNFDGTRTFRWTPEVSGVQHLTFTATDGQDPNSHVDATMSITVVASPQLVAAKLNKEILISPPPPILPAPSFDTNSKASTEHMCISVPERPNSFGTLDLKTLKLFNKSIRYVRNPSNLSTARSAKGASIRQRFVPSNVGSRRVIADMSIDAKTSYELKQSIIFEEGFEWGGDAQSGKFGFGLAGGSAPTGGSTSKAGFTARLSWRGQGDGTANAFLYLYSADRSLNYPYGDEIEIPNFLIPVGKWFDVTIRLKTNSKHNLADGSISVKLNDEILLERDNIQWQKTGDKTVIDRLIYSSFHGGNSRAHAPSKTVYAQFADTCLYE